MDAAGGRARLRMGIHTGTARVAGDDYWGIDVHYAARLCGAAHGGQVLDAARRRGGEAARAEAERRGAARELDDTVEWALAAATQLAASAG